MANETRHGSSEQTIGDSLEAALQAGCQCLIELELMRSVLDQEGELAEHLARAISALRCALSHLRVVSADHASFLAYGFVLASAPTDPRSHRRG